MNEIRDLWESPRSGGTGPGGEADVFVGPQADESTFKAVASGHRIVHLATHAFFAGDGCGGADTFEDSPLLLSGLAFAGANRRNDPAASRGRTTAS